MSMFWNKKCPMDSLRLSIKVVKSEEICQKLKKERFYFDLFLCKMSINYEIRKFDFSIKKFPLS